MFVCVSFHETPEESCHQSQVALDHWDQIKDGTPHAECDLILQSDRASHVIERPGSSREVFVVFGSENNCQI